jgi:hypothetical protein
MVVHHYEVSNNHYIVLGISQLIFMATGGFGCYKPGITPQ